MTRAVERERRFDGCVCFIGKSGLQTVSIQLRTVLSRAKCKNEALTKIVIYVTGRKDVMDGEKEKMNRGLWKRERGQPHSVLWD